MNPLWIGAIVGHLARDFLPAGFLPTLSGTPATGTPPQPAGVRPSGVRAGEDERVSSPLESEDSDAFERAPLGPIPLDEGISESYERAVWAAYRDPNAPPEQLMGFSQALEMEGMPISAGVLRARVLELGRIRESERIQRQFAAQAAAARAARESGQVRPSSVRAGEERVGPVPTRDQAHASGRAGEERVGPVPTRDQAHASGRAGEERVGPVPTRDQTHASGRAGEEGTPEISTEAAAPPAPVVQVKKKAGPRVRVTTAEPLTNGHNGETMMPPDEEENEPPPAAARA